MATISREARRELVSALQARYHGAGKHEKGTILKELVAVSGFHRKHAVRLLRQRDKPATGEPWAGQRVYGEA
jgi:hypothetical protein